MNDEDIQTVLAKRHHNGGDFWATEDGRLYVGSPFSTLSSLGILHELGVPQTHEAVMGGVDLIFRAWRDDGQIRLAPKAPLYPCYTAEAARVLCRFGYAEDERVQLTAAYLLDNAHDTGGWRCNFTRLGRGPETVSANPGATLFVLDVLRSTGHEEAGVAVDEAVQSLLAHWDTRARCGPCHYGMGRRFFTVEYPFLRYNLFYYVYVLSFFAAAHGDRRFRSAFAELTGKLNAEGGVRVEHRHRGLKDLRFCRKDEVSVLATRRYEEIVARLT